LLNPEHEATSRTRVATTGVCADWRAFAGYLIALALLGPQISSSSRCCLAAVHAMVHLESRYMYLPKIFSVVALVALMAPGGPDARRA
jgi:hypothetical protein